MRSEADQEKKQSFTILLYSQFPGENTEATRGHSRKALKSKMSPREKTPEDKCLYCFQEQQRGKAG